MSRGIFIGRFIPPHTGHVAMIRAASAMVDRLTILVCWQPDDVVPVALRLEWLREMFPDARVIGRETPPPATWAENPARWAALVRDVHPERLDQLFTSDRSQAPLAAELRTRFIMIDPDHRAVPAWSDRIRADPWGNWHYLPPVVRHFFARTICLHGPESTGKSTLAPQLAAHFDTLYVPEYGRTYCEEYGLSLGMGDLVTIGRTHAALTQALLRQCNRRLFLDTDPMMTAAWADMLFDRRDPWFDAFTGTADLYLLLDIDVPWIDDGTRFFGDDSRRRRFFDLSLAELERRGLNYRIIGGPPEERFGRALAAIADAGL